MKKEYASLELQVLSCEELRAFNFFQKLSAYVKVFIVADTSGGTVKQLHPSLQMRHKTPTSKGGHRNPEWNHDVGFDLSAVSPRDYSDLFLQFDVRLPSVVRSRSIGKFRTSLQDLVEDFNGVVQNRRYQMKNDDGKGKGFLNFRYKLCGKSDEPGDELARTEPSSEAPVPGHNASHFGYLEWRYLPAPPLIRGILDYQTYSPSLLLQTTNKKDVNKASTGYGYQQSWYSMAGPPVRSC